MTIDKQLELAMRQSIDSISAASGGEQTCGGDKELQAAIKARTRKQQKARVQPTGGLPLPSHCATISGGEKGVFGGRRALH